MPTDHRERLAGIRRFDQLVAYLREEMDWPIDSDDFEEVTFDYTPEELGIDAENAAKVQEIKRLRPLAPGQPWGVFFVKFAPKRLPVVALRRILGQVTLRKRASANSAERQAWTTDDLLFISNYGDGEARQIAFAHFSKPREGRDLPTLKVLGWDNLDTPLRLDAVARALRDHLVWPEDNGNAEAWRDQWRAAFTLRHREVITTSRQLSARLAELAKAVRDRTITVLSVENESGRLTQLMKAFRTALVHDLDEDGFADMYAQTIAYGLLSARITDPEQATADDFASHMRTNPFLRDLLASFLRAGGRRGTGGPDLDFDELGVSEVVELLNDAVVALNETIRTMAEIDKLIESHGGWPAAFEPQPAARRGVEEAAEVLPFRPRTVEPAPEDRYVTCVPLVPLKAAASRFSGQQLVEEDVGFEWVEVGSRHRLRPGMFVAQVVGRSMEPTIPDGSWCLFRGPVEGSRQGRNVLVQLRDATDPETGQHYTVKRYKSAKAKGGESWRHQRITLEPANPEFEELVFLDAEEDELQIIAEFVEVLAN